MDPDNIGVENHSKQAGLQIADVLTSASASALEPNAYGDIGLRYALMLRGKALLRKAAERTIEGLWAAIGCFVDVITPQKCANSFAAAGYDAD